MVKVVIWCVFSRMGNQLVTYSTECVADLWQRWVPGSESEYRNMRTISEGRNCFISLLFMSANILIEHYIARKYQETEITKLIDNIYTALLHHDTSHIFFFRNSAYFGGFGAKQTNICTYTLPCVIKEKGVEGDNAFIYI